LFSPVVYDRLAIEEYSGECLTPTHDAPRNDKSKIGKRKLRALKRQTNDLSFDRPHYRVVFFLFKMGICS
jgi:hypothetical protein